MDYFSPLRYPGGKNKISNFFKQLYKENNLYDGIYIEPYAGGASIALSLLLNEYASKIIINDLDYSIYSFWYSVLFMTEELCKLIHDTTVDINNWYKQKEIQITEKVNKLALGFSTFYLNRTNRSGIINAGFIGGKNQTGNWKINARFKKDELITRIQRIAKYKNRIELYNLDALELINKMRDELKNAKVLLYLDPPYYIKGKDLYLNFYNENNHKDVYDIIKNIKKYKWIITYDCVNFIKTLYKKYRQLTYSLNYSASQYYKGNELVIFSDNLCIPKSPDLNSYIISDNLTFNPIFSQY